MTILIRPYKEVSISWKQDQTGFLLSSPWLELSIEVDEQNKSSLYKTTNEIFNNKEINSIEAQNFLSFFKDFPLVKFDPRTTFEGKLYCPKNISTPLYNYKWDIDSILNQSQIPDTQTYDPIAVYSLLAHKRYLSEQKCSEELSMSFELDKIRIQDEKKFFKIVATILKQSLEITKRCCECIAPAYDLYAPAKEMVSEYSKSEEGHYNFVIHSLKKFGLNKEEIKALPLFSETTLSMDILKQAASENFLAFSCVVAVFESAGFHNEDPIASLLRKSSIPNSAIGLETHFKINKEEGHAQIGLDFAQTLGPVSKEAVIHAANLMEIVTDAGNELNVTIANQY